MHPQNPQRAVWIGPPERLPAAFRLAKSKADRSLVAVCEVWSHPLGWELRLEVDGHGLQMSSVARSAGETLGIAEAWRVAIVEKGWSR